MSVVSGALMVLNLSMVAIALLGSLIHLFYGLKDTNVRVIISMVVLCNVSDIAEHDRRRSGLPSAPLYIKFGNNSIKQ